LLLSLSSTPATTSKTYEKSADRTGGRDFTAGSVWTIKRRKEENIGKGWFFDKKEEEEKARGERKGTQE